MNIKSNEHLEGYKIYQALALDFAQSLDKLTENDSPENQVKRLVEAAKAAEKYFQIYQDAVEGEKKIIRQERDRLKMLNNKPL